MTLIIAYFRDNGYEELGKGNGLFHLWFGQKCALTKENCKNVVT